MNILQALDKTKQQLIDLGFEEALADYRCIPSMLECLSTNNFDKEYIKKLFTRYNPIQSINPTVDKTLNWDNIYNEVSEIVTNSK